MKKLLSGQQESRAVVFIMKKEAHRKDCLHYAKKLEAEGIYCLFEEQSGKDGEENFREGEVLHPQREILVITDDDRTARLCGDLGFACIGYRPPDEGSGYFSHVRMVWESFEDREAEEVEQFRCRFYGEPVLIARTERLLIRESIPEDFEAVYRMESDMNFPYGPEKKKFHSYSEEKEKFCSYIEHVYPFFGYGYWTVELAEPDRRGEVIGCCGVKDYDPSDAGEYVVLTREAGCGTAQNSGAALLQADALGLLPGSQAELFRLELGYVVAEPYRRQGYAYEMCSAVIGYAFSVLDADAVVVRIHPQNLPSLKLARRLRFH